MATIASSLAQASTLWDLLSGPPSDSVAIILPETGTRVTIIESFGGRIVVRPSDE